MSNQQDKIKDIQNLSFEAALEALENIVGDMENGNTSLDNSIESYEYGVALRKHLENKLAAAKLRISKITDPQAA